MMSIILGIIVVAIGLTIMFIVENWALLLVLITVSTIAGVSIYWFCMRRYETQVVETDIVSVNPIIETQSQKVGSSVGYGYHLTYHEHYRDVDVKTGERITFRVKWKNGRTSYVMCKRGDATFKRLYKKLSTYPLRDRVENKQEKAPTTQMELLAHSLKALENKRKETEVLNEKEDEVVETISVPYGNVADINKVNEEEKESPVNPIDAYKKQYGDFTMYGTSDRYKRKH